MSTPITITFPKSSVSPQTASATYLAKAIQPINVRDFGATGNGATDDTDAIQAAIDIADGRTVYFPTGVYCISDELVLRDDSALAGDGYTSEIKQIGADVFTAIYGTSVDHISIRQLQINGNRSVRQAGLPQEAGDNGSNGIRIDSPDASPSSGIEITDVWVHGTSHVGIMIFNAEHVTIARCKLDDLRRDGIDVWFNSRYVTLTDNIITNAADDCISISGENVAPHQAGARVRDVTISGGIYNHRDDAENGRGLYVSGCENLTITGAVIRDTFSHGIQVDQSYLTHYPSERISISGCVISNAGNSVSSGSGISITAGIDVSLTNNTIEGSYQSGILINGVAAKNTSVIGNTVRGGQIASSIGITIAFGAIDTLIASNRVEATPSYGISIGAHHTTVIGNIVFGACDVSTSNSYIVVAANISECMISNNKIVRNVGKGLYGIRITPGTSTDIMIIGNLVKSAYSTFAVGNGISDASSGGTNVIANNVTP